MDEKKKLRRLPKCIVSFMLTLAMTLMLMPMMSMEVMADASSGYTTDANGLMEHCLKSTNTYDVKGYVNGWKQITYDDKGFMVGVYNGNEFISVTSTPSFIANGKAIKITYTVTNTGSSSVSNCGFYIAADTKIDGNDHNTNTTNDGVVIMTSGGVSFFAFSTTQGTPVVTDRFYNNYTFASVNYDTVITGKYDPSTVTPVPTPYDSAFVMYFPKATIAAGQQKEYTLIVGMVDTTSVDTTIRNVKEAAFHTCGSSVMQAGQAATCTEDGFKDYYKCGGCDKLYEETACTNEITNLATWKATAGQGKIAALGHDWGHNASGATLTATCKRNASHTATLTLTANSDLTYNGSPKTATIGNWSASNVTNLAPKPTLVTYVNQTGTDTYNSTTAPTNAGSYTASITVSGATASVNFTIAKANSSANPSAKILTYTGGPQELVDKGTVTGGEIQFATSEDGPYSTTIPLGTNAGDYTVWYKVVGDKNHNDKNATQISNVKINKADVTLDGVTASDKTYDGTTDATLTSNGSLSGILNDDDLSYTVTGTFADINAGPNKDVNLTVTLTGAAKDNYKTSSTSQTKTSASILKKDITTTITPNGGTYSKTITPASAVFNDTVSGETVTPVIKYSGTAYNGTTYTNVETAPDNAGEYETAISLSESDAINYNLTGTTTATFKVNKLPLTDSSIKLVIPTTSFIKTQAELENIGTITLDGIDLSRGTTTLTSTSDYTVEGDSSDKFGVHQVTFKGVDNYTGELVRDWSITQTKQEPVTINAPEGEDPFTNKLTVTITGDEDAPKVTVNTPLDVLTAEDKALLKDPTQNVDIDVILTLKNKLEEKIEDDSLTEIKKITKNNKNVRYLDITLEKVLKTLGGANNDVVEDEVTIPITNLATPIEITIDLPKDIPSVRAGYSRKYTIIRSHLTPSDVEGEDPTYVAEVLTTTYSNGRLTFKTDKFSDYALMYVDTSIPRHYKAPNTGVVGATTVMTSNRLIEIGVLALGSVIGLISTRKKKEDK